MPAGRPTKKPEDICKELDKYLEQVKKTNGLASVAGFCVFLDISKPTIYEWIKADKEFSNYLRRLDARQEAKLIEYGLDGTWNSNITKMLLAGHGYSDKMENKHVGDENNPVAIKKIERVIVKPSN